MQLPLPEQVSERAVINAIAPEKDVDAFHPINVGRMVTGEGTLMPCTPAGIMDMLHEYGISPDGKHCVIVGRSNIVGRPMGLMLLNADATVTYCHRHTRDLASFTRQADILIVAAGSPRLIRGDMVKDGAAVIDVAMNRDPETANFFGDVCFDEVEPKAAFITPYGRRRPDDARETDEKHPRRSKVQGRKMNDKRLYGIDLFKALAMFLVVVLHVNTLGTAFDSACPALHQWWLTDGMMTAAYCMR